MKGHVIIQENFDRNYLETHCWQYEIRKRNFDSDLKESGLTEIEIKNLKVSDFEFAYVKKENDEKCKEIRNFIKKHEWLGKMPTRPTHRFIATYKGRLAGAVVMSTPNAFSNLLGAANRDLEKLISRGACISWSPKNLASALIMYSIRWMVQNTEFRFFTAYSDVEAKELGTIYQACNFTYIGQKSGAAYNFFDKDCPERGWFSDRQFRKTSQIKRYAKELNISWGKGWSGGDQVFWKNIPADTVKALRQKSYEHKYRCIEKKLKPKHKYVYILGKNKRETQKLKDIFNKRNPQLLNREYPKLRGAVIDTAVKVQIPKEKYLTKELEKGRPQTNEPLQNIEVKKYLTVQEALKLMNISEWSIYNLIHRDPTFPYVNIGVKKKYLIDASKLSQWIENRIRASQNAFNSKKDETHGRT